MYVVVVLLFGLVLWKVRREGVAVRAQLRATPIKLLKMVRCRHRQLEVVK